jgi:hypothetical protein
MKSGPVRCGQLRRMSDSGNSHLKADWRQRSRSERLNPPHAVFTDADDP